MMLRSTSSSLLVVLLIAGCGGHAYSPQGRWGQASTVLSNFLYIHGGKVDPSNEFAYSSAPNTNDLISLDLSSPFPLSDPPWQFLAGSENTGTSQGPAVSFHTITAYSPSMILSFGGDGGPPMPISTYNDSAWLLDVSDKASPLWTSQATSWADEPTRRIYHGATAVSGTVWITGGQKADQSGLSFSDCYQFQPAAPPSSPASFVLVNSDWPDLVGHRILLLTNGTLILLGGYSSSSNTLQPFSQLWLIDTTSTSPKWWSTSIEGAVPVPRRGFAAALVDGNKVLIHGGADATMQTVYSDGAVLDLGSLSWSAAAGMSSVLGPRHEHFAVGLGSQVMFGFGYGSSGPSNSDLSIYDTNTGTWVSIYNPPSTSTLSNPPGSPSRTSSPHPGFTSALTTALTTTNSAGSLTVIHTTETLIIATGLTTTFTTTLTGASSTASTAPSPTSSKNSNSSHNHVVAITISGVLGAFALVILVIIFVYYCRRRKRSNAGWYKGEGDQTLIWRDNDGDDDNFPEDGVREKGPMAVSGWLTAPERTKTSAAWAILTRGASKPEGLRSQRQRFDMLADEDEREFADIDAAHGPRRDATTSSAGSYNSDRPWYRRSASGKRSWVETVGAAVARQVSGGSGKSKGDNATPDWWQHAEGVHPDEASLLGAADLAGAVAISASPRDERQYPSTRTWTSSRYHDPWSGSDGHGETSGLTSPAVEETEMGVIPVAGSSTGPGTAQYRPLPSPPPTKTHPLINVITAASDGSYGNSTNSRPSTSSGSSNILAASKSNRERSDSNLISPTSTIMSKAPSAPLKRSETWWTRFSRTSLLGEPGSPTSPRRLSFRLSGTSFTPDPPKFLDFRDPNPPPRLHAIEESGNTPDGSPESPAKAKNAPLNAKRRSGLYGIHGRSSTSLQTTDTEMLERIGGRVDVVQRMHTDSTHTASPSETSISSAIQGEYIPSSEHGELVMSPIPLRRSPSPPHRLPALVGPRVPPPPPTNSRVKRPLSEVASRIAAYEQYSQELIPGGPRLPSTRPETAQERQQKRKLKVVPSWDIVDKPELFVANPDSRRGTGDTDSAAHLQQDSTI